MEKSRKKFKKVIFYILYIIILCFIIFMIDINNYSNRDINLVKETEKINYNIAFNKILSLQKQYDNKDIKAILSIDGIDNFSYPVAQTSNNDFYLNHDYQKEYNKLGAVMADYRVDLDISKKKLIFGHSSTKNEVPFNILEKYYNKYFFDTHKYITLETETNTYRYEIFSVYIETSDFTYMNINFDNQKDWYSHLQKLQSKSLYQTNMELNDKDEILIIQTCSNHTDYQEYSKKYLIIVSRRV